MNLTLKYIPAAAGHHTGKYAKRIINFSMEFHSARLTVRSPGELRSTFSPKYIANKTTGNRGRATPILPPATESPFKKYVPETIRRK